VRTKTLALWLSGAIPWIAYVFTCSDHAYWLDSGEFVAAAVRLDIAHPPGHPLTEIYGKAWSLLPLGSLSLRLALGQAAATSLACVFLCRASAALLASQGVAEALRWPCALFASWLSAFTYGLWFQAVRPEVYALQTLCTSIVIERVLRYQAEPSAPPARYAGPACFALGLGLANHHFTAVLLLPGMLVPLAQLLRRRRLRVLAGALGLGALALATYVYLPLRAARPLAANLGQPDSWSRFWWVVSARVYARGAGGVDTGTFGERLADVLLVLLESFRYLPLAAACIGGYVLLRFAATRSQGLFLLALLVPNLVARAWLGPVRSNPDVLGYFGSTLLVIGLLGASALAAVYGLLAERARLLLWAAPCLPALALLNLPFAYSRSQLADFTATDSFDDMRFRSLPARSVVIESMPQTVFRHWELDAVERVRPDLAQVPVPFLTHPGMRDALIGRSPSLAGIVDGYLERDSLRCGDLRASAEQRPTWLELDVRAPPACYPLLAPAHLMHGVGPQLSAAETSRQLQLTYTRLYAELGAGREETETGRQLLAVHYLNAAHFAALGARGLAREELARALRIAPSDGNVLALARALEQGEGPLAIEPFLAL
jgi:hypothetical protein